MSSLRHGALSIPPFMFQITYRLPLATTQIILSDYDTAYLKVTSNPGRPFRSLSLIELYYLMVFIGSRINFVKNSCIIKASVCLKYIFVKQSKT